MAAPPSLKYLDQSTVDNLLLVGDEYQLEDDSVYLVVGQINLQDKALRIGYNTVLRGFSDGVIFSSNKKSVIRSSPSLGGNVILREFSVVAPLAEYAIHLVGLPKENHANLFFIGIYGNRGLYLDGFNVQSVKDCYFETKSTGLTLAGSTNKAFISSTPFYGDSQPAAILLHETLRAGVIDIVTCFFKFDDAYCIKAEPGYKIGEGRLRGSLIDGFAKPLKGLYPQDVAWWMSDNTGIKNSNIVAELHSIPKEDTKVQLSRKDGTPKRISPLTISGDRNERFTNNGDGSFTYINEHRPATLTLHAFIAFDTRIPKYTHYNLYVARNDEIIPESLRAMSWEYPRVQFLEAVAANPFDTFSFWIEFASGTISTRKATLTLSQIDVVARG